MSNDLLVRALVTFPFQAFKRTVVEYQRLWSCHSILWFPGATGDIEHVIDDRGLLEAVANKKEYCSHAANLMH